MSIRDLYITAMTKTAAEEKPVDSQEKALDEVKDNKKDSTSEVKSLFKNTGKAQQQATKTMDKVLPGKTEKETGNNPILKVAFAAGMGRARSPFTSGQVGVMFSAFKDELEQIAT